MGPRLAKILDKILDKNTMETTLSNLSLMQARQIDGLCYCKLLKLQLKEVTKRGNMITIVFNTVLDSNVRNIKKTHLTFKFVDGVSDDMATNDYFSGVSRFVRKK